MTNHEYTVPEPEEYASRFEILEYLGTMKIALLTPGLNRRQHDLQEEDHERPFITLPVPGEELIENEVFSGWEECTIYSPVAENDHEIKFVFEAAMDTSEGVRRTIHFYNDGTVKDDYTTVPPVVLTAAEQRAIAAAEAVVIDAKTHVTEPELLELPLLLLAAIHHANGTYEI